MSAQQILDPQEIFDDYSNKRVSRMKRSEDHLDCTKMSAG
jgi:hypothetical protein